MFKTLRVLKRLVALLLLLMLAASLAIATYGYRHQTQILQKLVQAANQHLSIPVKIHSVQLTTFRSFPSITLTLQEVVMEDDAQTTTWLTARKVHCAFDLWKMLQGKYVLEQVTLEQGHLDLAALGGYLAVAETGNSAATTPHNTLAFDLQKLIFQGIDLTHRTQDGQWTLHTDRLQVTLQPSPSQLQVHLKGQLTVRYLPHQAITGTPKRPLTLLATLTYDQNQHALLLQSAKIQQGGAQVVAHGMWDLDSATSRRLRLQGEGIALQTLLQYAPAQSLLDQLQGQLSFDIQLQKPKDAQRLTATALRGNFSLQNGSWTTPYCAQSIQLKTIHGTLAMADLQDLTTGKLQVDQITGSLVNSQIVGSLSLNDFQKCHLQCTARGTVDLAALKPEAFQASWTAMAGQLTLDGTLDAYLKTQALAAQAAPQITGTIKLQQGRCKTTSPQQLWQDLNGHLTLEEQALVVKTLTGSVGTSNFCLSGTFQYPGTLWSSNTALPMATAKVYIDYLDVDTLFSEEAGAEASPALFVPPCTQLDLECDIQQLHYRRFQGKNVRGTLRLQGHRLKAEKLQFGMAGGKVTLHSTLELGKDSPQLRTKAKLQGVDLSQLFYTCENFHQNFLLDKHLRGKVSADCHWKLQLDEHWRANWKTLQAGIDVQLYNGLLCDFPPIQQLAAYVPKESLTAVHFPALKNHISIQQSTIYIPTMEVYNNVAHMQLSGTHTFDGKIDYSFVVPLSSTQLLPQEALATDALDGINLHLKLQGDVNNYKVIYNVQALKNSLKDDLKKQGQVLKQILQGTYRSKTNIQALTPDDYFEFD